MLKNSNESADQKIVNILNKLKGIATELKIDYLIFGSCGLQSYQKYFYRLPNDIDFIVRKRDLGKFISKCKHLDYPVFEEQGRYKVIMDDFPVHLIPEVFSVITKPDLSVLGTVSFTSPMDLPTVNKAQFLNTNEAIPIKVMNLEYCLMMELARKQDTNTFFALYLIFDNPTLKVDEFLKLVDKHPFLISRILSSLDIVGELLEKYLSINQPNASHVNETLISIRVRLALLTS